MTNNRTIINTISKARDEAQCIYCLALKPFDEFNKEHVIHRCMTGKFQPLNLTLIKTVCTSCNQYLGDSLDLALGRGYWEGLSRFQHDMKTSSKARELSTTNIQLRAEDAETFRDEVGEFEDILSDHLRLELKDKSIVRFTKQILLNRPIEQLIDLAEVVGYRVFAATDESNEEIAVLIESPLRLAGFEINRVFKHPVTATATYDVVAFRAFSKIAFNYFAKLCEHSPELALSRDFDQIRSFIRFAETPDFRAITLLEADKPIEVAGKPLKGHWMRLRLDRGYRGRQVIVELSLFNRHQWRVVLTDGMFHMDLPSELQNMHIWDLRTMRCESVDPQT